LAEISDLFLIGNSEEIHIFDLRKKEYAMKFDNSKLKLENFLQIENKKNYFSAIDSINSRNLIYDIRYIN